MQKALASKRINTKNMSALFEKMNKYVTKYHIDIKFPKDLQSRLYPVIPNAHACHNIKQQLSYLSLIFLCTKSEYQQEMPQAHTAEHQSNRICAITFIDFMQTN